MEMSLALELITSVLLARYRSPLTEMASESIDLLRTYQVTPVLSQLFGSQVAWQSNRDCVAHCSVFK